MELEDEGRVEPIQLTKAVGSWFRRLLTAALLAALLSPAVRDHDSLPLSTYPMYSGTRSNLSSFATAVGVDASGASSTLSALAISGSRDRLIAQAFLNDAVQRGDADMICLDIARRADRSLETIEIAFERHDTIARLQGGDSLRETRGRGFVWNRRVTAISRAQAGVVQRADRWLLAAARPERLAVLRVAVGMYAVINLLVSVGEFSRLAGRSQAEFVPVGLANLLGGPVSSTTLWALFLVSLASGVAFVIGYRFELSGPVFALLTLAWVTYHSSWGQMLHFEHVLSLHLLVIGFSPAADALSADARSTRAVERTSSERYGWPVRLLAIITVVTYALAGFAKLRASGWAWVDGTTLANHIAYSATRLDLLGEPRPPLASTVINQSWMLGPMALAGIGVELLAPLALLRRFRNVWVVAVLGFHLGTLLTMFVFFPFNGLGFALLPLYRLEGVADWVRRRAGTGRYWPVSHSDGSTSLEA